MRANSEIALLISVSVCRLICGLAVIKAMSWFLGPAQFGTISQISGVCTAFYTFAGGAVTNAVMVKVGGNADTATQDRWLASALAIGFAASVVLAVLAGVLYLTASPFLFGTNAVSLVFVGIALVQVIIGVGNILLAFASGTRDVASFALAQIAGTLLWAGLTVAATVAFGFSGAVVAVVLAPACTALVILGLYRRRLRPLWVEVMVIDSVRTATLLKASGLLIVAICALPVANTVIRADLAARNGWHDVGIWQAVVRLSDAYMQVFGVLALNLLLPRLVGQRVLAERRVVLFRIGAAMAALFVTGSIALYVLGEPVLRLAYSAEFLPAARYIAPQLGGDFAKVLAWILVYWFIAGGVLAAQPAAEIIQAVCLVLFYWLLWPSHGAMAPVLSHVLSCIVLLCVLALAAWRMRVS